jgi:hypothetical protein
MLIVPRGRNMVSGTQIKKIPRISTKLHGSKVALLESISTKRVL